MIRADNDTVKKVSMYWETKYDSIISKLSKYFINKEDNIKCFIVVQYTKYYLLLDDLIPNRKTSPRRTIKAPCFCTKSKPKPKREYY